MRSILIESIDISNYPSGNLVESGSRGLPNWKARGWRTASKSPVKNRDLWEALDVLVQRHDVAWHWVRGHAGNPENERADTLAREALKAAAA